MGERYYLMHLKSPLIPIPLVLSLQPREPSAAAGDMHRLLVIPVFTETRECEFRILLLSHLNQLEQSILKRLVRLQMD